MTRDRNTITVIRRVAGDSYLADATYREQFGDWTVRVWGPDDYDDVRHGETNVWTAIADAIELAVDVHADGLRAARRERERLLEATFPSPNPGSRGPDDA